MKSWREECDSTVIRAIYSQRELISLAGPTPRREKLNFFFQFANKHKVLSFISAETGMKLKCAAELCRVVVTLANEKAIYLFYVYS